MDFTTQMNNNMLTQQAIQNNQMLLDGINANSIIETNNRIFAEQVLRDSQRLLDEANGVSDRPNNWDEVSAEIEAVEVSILADHKRMEENPFGSMFHNR